MVITYYSPQITACEQVQMRSLPTCVADTVGAQEATFIRDKLYRRCKSVGAAAFHVELWNCIQKGGDCDDAEPIDQGKYNSTDVKLARQAFQNITELKMWSDGHKKLPGCYSVDGMPVEPPVDQIAIFDIPLNRPNSQKGYAWITCGYHPDHGNWTVDSVHLGMDKLFYAFQIGDGFFEDLDLLPGLKTLEISNMGIGKVGNLSDHIWKLNGTLTELILQKNNLERLAVGGYGLENLKLLTKLDLYYNNLDQVPDEIKKLGGNLQYLDLGHNILTELPDYNIVPARANPDPNAFWPRMMMLDTLILSDNNIKVIPATFGGMPALRVLKMKNNMVRLLPPEIEGLRTLVELDLSNNDLFKLPNEIGKLKRLVQLDISGNDITQLPPNIGNMDGLVWLNMQNNKVDAIPDNVWKMDSIAIIMANYNQISYIPKEIGMCKTLSQLLLSNNRLLMLPEELGQLESLWSLDLSHNNLEGVPFMGDSPRLAFLDIRENNYLRCLPGIPEGETWNGPLGKFLTDRPDIKTCEGHTSMPTMMPTQPTLQPTCEDTSSEDPSAASCVSTLLGVAVPLLALLVQQSL